MTVGATRTGGINARAKSLGRAQSGLKGFRAGLAHFRGNVTLSTDARSGEGCLPVGTLPPVELTGLTVQILEVVDRWK